MRGDEGFNALSISNPNKAWVCNELDKLITEWKEWNGYCQSLGDSPDYDAKTCTEAIKDGLDNRRKHEVLREKTLVFMRNHFDGAEFILESWRSHPHESNTSRLKEIVPNWIHRLEILKASMAYVIVPEGFWITKGKELIDTLSKTSAEKSVDVVASYLKNPYDSGAK